jgi:flagellar motility protein MotE (MotC chaperone)
VKPLTAHLRILPVLCIAAALLLCVKLVDIGSAIGVAAEPTKGHGEAAKAPPTPLTPAVSPPQQATAPAPGAAAPAPAAPAPAARAPAAAPPAAETPPANEPRQPADAKDPDVVSGLSERRAELDRRAEEVQQREVLLKATEQRINEKIAKLQQIEKTIDDGAKKQDDEEEARLKSLVKIYETMKPKDAARILDQLEMPVLLKVLQRMKEAKSSPILASMDAQKAKEATIALADKNVLAEKTAEKTAPNAPAAAADKKAKAPAAGQNK